MGRNSGENKISTKCMLQDWLTLSTFWENIIYPSKNYIQHFPAFLHFLAFDLEEPITKQYLENCPKNATYDMQQFIKKEVDTKLRNASDAVIFADEAISVAKKEIMTGIYPSSSTNVHFLK